MKKLIYIVFALVLITAISCKKEVIQPNNIIDHQINSNIRGDKDFGDNNASNPDNEKSNSGNTTNTAGVNPIDSTHVITDPNRDDDDVKKPKIN